MDEEKIKGLHGSSLARGALSELIKAYYGKGELSYNGPSPTISEVLKACELLLKED